MRRLALISLLAAVLAPLGKGADAVADLQAMIDATPAGATLTIGPGSYTGRLTISRPITIVGEGYPIIDAAGTGTVITVNAPDVTIQGLIIRGSGSSHDHEDAGITVTAPRVRIVANKLEDVLFGVNLSASPDSLVKDNLIGGKDVAVPRRGDPLKLWESHRSTVEGNVITDGRDCVIWFSDDLVIRNNQINAGRYGIHFMYSNRAVLEENRLSDNSVGAFLMNSRGLIFTGNEISGSDGPSGYGLGLKDMDEVEATANQFSGNRVGIFIDNSPTTTRLPQLFTDNLFAFNDIGLAFLPAVKGNIFTGNAFVDNRRHVAVLGTGSFDGNTWTVDGLGNYWSDFAGYDADGDGVGDIAFRIDDLFATLTDRQPMLTFLAETPSAKLLDAAADAFPILRPSAIVVDEAPMMNMPMTLASEVEGNRTLFGLVAVLMLGIAAVILRAGFRGTVS